MDGINHLPPIQSPAYIGLVPVQTQVVPWVNSNCPQEQKRLIHLRIRPECYLPNVPRYSIQCSMFNSSRYLFTFTGTKIQYDDVHQMLVKLLKPRPGQVLINQHQSTVIWWRDGLHRKHLSCDGAPITLCFQYLVEQRIVTRFFILSGELWKLIERFELYCVVASALPFGPVPVRRCAAAIMALSRKLCETQ